MSVKLLLAAALAQFVLIFILGIATAVVRVRAARSGRVRIKDVALSNEAWPPRVIQLTNAFNNQFEVPLLFMAVAGFAIATGVADMVQAVLAWVFVASRLVHALIHTGRNNVLHRFLAFLFGFTMVTLMWGWLALRIYVTG
jgi:hypothetical protein